LGLKFLINPLKKIAQFTFVLNGGWYWHKLLLNFLCPLYGLSSSFLWPIRICLYLHCLYFYIGWIYWFVQFPVVAWIAQSLIWEQLVLHFPQSAGQQRNRPCLRNKIAPLPDILLHVRLMPLL
jgi:hypothetical protein